MKETINSIKGIVERLNKSPELLANYYTLDREVPSILVEEISEVAKVMFEDGFDEDNYTSTTVRTMRRILISHLAQLRKGGWKTLHKCEDSHDIHQTPLFVEIEGNIVRTTLSLN